MTMPRPPTPTAATPAPAAAWSSARRPMLAGRRPARQRVICLLVIRADDDSSIGMPLLSTLLTDSRASGSRPDRRSKRHRFRDHHHDPDHAWIGGAGVVVGPRVGKLDA